MMDHTFSPLSSLGRPPPTIAHPEHKTAKLMAATASFFIFPPLAISQIFLKIPQAHTSRNNKNHPSNRVRQVFLRSTN
ncbi:hypothetical protein [Saezia sanguinis]|uniref:hypothetical protein n=1 Tax=Saezia sanguinis TaxID=1965230 RepID=UPI0030D810C5